MPVYRFKLNGEFLWIKAANPRAAARKIVRIVCAKVCKKSEIQLAREMVPVK